MSRNAAENVDYPVRFSTRKGLLRPLAFFSRLGPKKVRTKIFLLFAVLMVAVSIFFITYFPSRLARHLVLDASQRIDAVTEMTSLTVASEIAGGDRIPLDTIIQAVADQSNEILYAVLESGAGVVLASVNGDVATREDYRNFDTEKPGSLRRRIYRTRTSVTSGGEEVGALFMGFSLRSLVTAIRKEKGVSGIVSFVIFAVSILIVFLLSGLITQPLTHMTRTAERIAKGDLRQRARIYSRDEVGLLAKAFNGMVDGVEKSYRDMERLNRTLEERAASRSFDLEKEISERRRIEKELRLAKDELENRVEKRTEELSKVNEELSGKVIETRRAEDQLQNTLERLEKALEGTVRAMSLTIEMRDLYTAGHQRRVSSLAVAIAEEMHMSWDKIEGIRLAGVIHDIGKIAMPAEILTKPTQLTKTEFQLIKDHPRIGFDILKSIEFPWPVAHIILQHHERMDGSGYPDGLMGDAILVEARILAVADVVEALSSHRPYRPALGLEKALEEIRRGRGIRYDMRVVDACLKLFKEGRYTFQSEGGGGLF